MATKADHPDKGRFLGNPNFRDLGNGNAASDLIFENRGSIKKRNVRNTGASAPNSDIRKNPTYSGSY
jgi:hypothetical protein